MTIKRLTDDSRQCRQCGTIYRILKSGFWPKQMLNCAVSDCRLGVRKDQAIRLTEGVRDAKAIND